MAKISDQAVAAARVTQATREAKEEAALAQPLSTLQKHIAVFDLNPDGKLTFGETRDSLKKMGLNAVSANLVAVIINSGLGPFSRGQGMSSLFERGGMDVNIAGLKAHQHEGDTGVFDAEGNFSQAAFDAMFDKYDKDRDGALSTTEISAMQHDRAKTRGGLISSKLEFTTLMAMAGDRVDAQGHRSLSRERLQSFYDGSLFYQLAEQVKLDQAASKEHGPWVSKLTGGWKK